MIVMNFICRLAIIHQFLHSKVKAQVERIKFMERSKSETSSGAGALRSGFLSKSTPLKQLMFLGLQIFQNAL